MIKPDITEGVRLFNSFDFFAAHDFFEDIWMSAPAGSRRFYQGMVQAAVGSYHLVNDNYKGALSQYTKSCDKLEAYAPEFMNVDVAGLIEGIEELRKDLKLFFSGSLSKVDIDKIPVIKFKI